MIEVLNGIVLFRSALGHTITLGADANIPTLESKKKRVAEKFLIGEINGYDFQEGLYPSDMDVPYLVTICNVLPPCPNWLVDTLNVHRSLNHLPHYPYQADNNIGMVGENPGFNEQFINAIDPKPAPKMSRYTINPKPATDKASLLQMVERLQHRNRELMAHCDELKHGLSQKEIVTILNRVLKRENKKQIRFNQNLTKTEFSSLLVTAIWGLTSREDEGCHSE